MDGGVEVYSKTYMTAVDSLHLSMEYIATESTSIQNEKMVNSTFDYNGALLYPDGSPRFRTIYTNGGSATNHGNSLGSDGRDIIREFYSNGGSYTGSCAGAFLTSISYQNTGASESYYHIWPGRTKTTGLLNTYTGQFITTNSPLLQYYDFGNDNYVDDVFHDGGCYAREDLDYPSQTEVLLRFDKPGKQMHNKASCWAYKEDVYSGRVVVIGSHPENADSGERMNLMQAIMQYALAGNGIAKIKTTLVDGVAVNMNKETNQNDPEHTKIGDLQYHHFKVIIPRDATNLGITVNAQNAYNLNIYLNKSSFAFKSNAQFSDTTNLNSKTLDVTNLDAGTYYVSVECDTTVTVSPQSWGDEYIGNLAVLNGISYSIQIDMILSVENEFVNSNIKIFPNPVSDFLNISMGELKDNIYKVEIINSNGQIVYSKQQYFLNKQQESLNISYLPIGFYILNITDNKNSIFYKKFVKVK